MHLSKMASKAGICLLLEPVMFTAFCYQFQFFNVIDGYVFLPSVGLLVFKLQLRKMAVQFKNSRRVRRVCNLWKFCFGF